ncbi:MAG: glycine zipper 2TM domain-containing protein [Gammaproteobacteria bacterium]|jgi:uncharacterized protein YcfJ|uniref:glycine zipper 2TM domain-containing protein n=1 Tax=Nevskia sp. TaxID=1929292 RepID=UPI00403627C4|nr:glycine zipper 2TM domain-containing protein [Gammaproteobacteria bacterium]
MNAQITSLLTAVAVLGTSATAQAGRRNDNTDYADVISSRPIYTDVRVSVPREECYQEKVVYDDGYRGRDNSGVGAVLGAVVGGVVGNRFGQGSGRAVATAAGAVVGASAGASIGRNNSRGYREPSYGYEERCRTIDESRYEQRVDGYDVRYRYHGRIYDTRLPYDPGDRLAVNVNVSPADY